MGPPLTNGPAIEAQSASMTSHQFLRSVIGRIHEEYNAEQSRDVLKDAGYRVTLDGFDGSHAVPDDAPKRAVS